MNNEPGSKVEGLDDVFDPPDEMPGDGEAPSSFDEVDIDEQQIVDASDEFLHPDEVTDYQEAQFAKFLGLREPPEGDYLRASANIALSILQDGRVEIAPHLLKMIELIDQREDAEDRKSREEQEEELETRFRSFEARVQNLESARKVGLTPRDAKRRR